jgi:DNA excision repair protein ERCC-4
MRILIDSREQAPYRFADYDVDLETAALPTGDYSLPGFQDRVSIERKELNDLIGCLMNGNRERFEKELYRGSSYDVFVVVIEGSMADVAEGGYRSAMKPHAAMQSIIALGVRYRVPFVWCGTRAAAEYFTFWTLQKYIRELSERYKAATKAQGEAA